MRQINLEELRRAARLKPAGYLDECFRMGTTRTGDNGEDVLELSDEAYDALARKYTVSFAVMVRNFTEATARWVAAGLPIVSREVFDARRAACDGCEHWDRTAFFARCGLCGCTRLKLELATEKCPVSKWEK